MEGDRIIDGKTKAVIVAVSILVILFPVGYSVVSLAFAQSADDSGPFLEMPDKKYDKCVRDARYMRFKHMDLLKGVRDRVMREGKKAEITVEGKKVEVSFNKCRECHTSRERFCDKCHNTVNLKLDCYGCHYFPK